MTLSNAHISHILQSPFEHTFGRSIHRYGSVSGGGHNDTFMVAVNYYQRIHEFLEQSFSLKMKTFFKLAFSGAPID